MAGRALAGVLSSQSSAGGRSAQSAPKTSIGVVTNNNDPEGRGRVKIRFPHLDDQVESYWARVTTPMSGKEWGIQFIPEVGDEVLVTFLGGDIQMPVIIGSLHNGEDKPPLKPDDGKNNLRIIRSRSGHEIVFDDTQDKCKLTIKSSSGAFVELDDASGKEKITIQDKTKNQKIVIDSAKNSITIECAKDLIVKTDTTMKVDAKDLDLSTTGNVKIKAAGKVEIEGSGGLDLKSSGMTNVKGSMVNIN